LLAADQEVLQQKQTTTIDAWSLAVLPAPNAQEAAPHDASFACQP
jgi:hypothetical protein